MSVPPEDRNPIGVAPHRPELLRLRHVPDLDAAGTVADGQNVSLGNPKIIKMSKESSECLTSLNVYVRQSKHYGFTDT